MPLFKVESSKSKRILIKSDSVADIIKTAVMKFNLPPDGDYKLFLQSDKTEIDDDEILIEYASQSTESVILSVLNMNDAIHTDVEQIENKYNLLNQNKSHISTASREHVLNVEEAIWSKVPQLILDKCENKEILNRNDRKYIYSLAVDYMMNTLKDNSRTTSGKIARELCDKYPKSFLDIIGEDGEVWGDGFQTLRLQIYNACNYKSSSKTNKRSLRDSDDEEIESREMEKELGRRQDEYGIVEYKPPLPESENAISQEEKRCELLKFYESGEVVPVSKLINETYPTLRTLINNRFRDLDKIASDWPCIKSAVGIITHSNRLLGNWNNSLNKKSKTIRQYFKLKVNQNKYKMVEIKELFDCCKETCVIRNDKIAKTLIIFPLLCIHFNENENKFYRINSIDIDDVAGAAESEYPILIIRGKSLFDNGAMYDVILNKTITITCSSCLEGLLVTFLCYYVFGFSYEPEIEKLLEFLQRVIFKINPKNGTKRSKTAKRIHKTYNPKVYNLAKALAAFSDDFSLINE